MQDKPSYVIGSPRAFCIHAHLRYCVAAITLYRENEPIILLEDMVVHVIAVMI